MIPKAYLIGQQRPQSILQRHGKSSVKNKGKRIERRIKQRQESEAGSRKPEEKRVLAFLLASGFRLLTPAF
jgi:hypothetical protein